MISIHLPECKCSTREKERKLELARNKWIQDMETLPGPHRELACDSTGHCFYPGVQGFFERGQGLVVCKDCTDPTIEGSYSKWRTWGVSEFIFSPVVGQFPPGSAQGLVNLSRSKGVCNIVAPAFNPLHYVYQVLLLRSRTKRRNLS